MHQGKTIIRNKFVIIAPVLVSASSLWSVMEFKSCIINFAFVLVWIGNVIHIYSVALLYLIDPGFSVTRCKILFIIAYKFFLYVEFHMYIKQALVCHFIINLYLLKLKFIILKINKWGLVSFSSNILSKYLLLKLNINACTAFMKAYHGTYRAN